MFNTQIVVIYIAKENIDPETVAKKTEIYAVRKSGL